MEKTGWVAGHLTGGLGNRLFQHAAAAGFSERHGRKLVFAMPQCGAKEHGPVENIFRLFPNVARIEDDTKPQMIPEPWGAAFTYVPLEDLYPPSMNLCIDGWRQTERYFPSLGIHANLDACISEGRRQELLKEYGLLTENQRFQTWFVHVRLGDYTKLTHHQMNLADYYGKAAAKIPRGATLLLFTDGTAQERETLQRFFLALGREVRLVNCQEELESLFLMSCCWGGCVVANSTFSWWGCYFARQRCPSPGLFHAYFPANWGAGLPPARDVVPSWGERIENSLG